MGCISPPELKDALVGVWSAYGKSNDSTDRNIIKNKIRDKGGDFEILNAAYKLNSGYGKYEVDFTKWSKRNVVTSNNDNSFSFESKVSSSLLYYSTTIGVDTPSFKIKANISNCLVYYYYINDKGTLSSISILESGEFELPISHNTLYNGNIGIGFEIGRINGTGTGTITQIPSFEGAFVTDGVDDLITSTKTVQEMLGGSNEITVVSMIHLVQTPAASSEKAYTNQIRTGQNYLRNYVTDNGKTGIYGYTCKGNNVSVINNILGDKNDYTVENKSWNNLAKFSVIGYEDNGTINELDQVAWYWTFIAKRVLTEDEINLVIEKYNLDRPGEIVKPDVYYDIKRQKISNDNHSAFDDKLIDYSGNGYDAKLYNFGWKEDSGIGKYGTDFTSWLKSIKITSLDSESFSFISDVNWTLLYYKSNIGKDMPSFKVKIKLDGDGAIYYNYITQEGILTNVSIKTEEFETPISYNTKYTGETPVNVGFTMGVRSGECSGTITQIPEYENALVFDGIDDYGKVTGLPILKDYTVAADYIRTFAKENAQDSPILSKSKVAGSGAFLFNYLNADSITSSYSFGTNNILKEINDSERKIYYLSKYASDGHNVNAGSAVDYDTMWLGTYRDNISNFFTGALYFAMLFPYSLSEFLLERQIKKARAGTLYSNQVEFRPIIPEDENITRIDYFVVNSGVWTVIKPGDYVDVGARIVLNIYTKLPYKIEKVSSLAFTGMSVRPSTELNIFDVEGYIKDKTPQKIKITLAVNEDIVQWTPTITSNLLDSFTASSWYLNGWDNTLTEGTWIKKTDRVFFKATFKTELYGLETATFGGAECVVSKADNWSNSVNIWDIRMLETVGDLSQVFNLDVYELIRYEDIVQPYPEMWVITQNANRVSWGDKLKVGSEFGYNSKVNLLSGLYSTANSYYNGKVVKTGDVLKVEKQMVFACDYSWIGGTNEPKCILSPSRLRIPNSSYKILGYIPDLSGNGNHGKINNSAYAGMSGANGYITNFSNWKYRPSNTSSQIKITDSSVTIKSELNDEWIIWNDADISAYKIRISGLKAGCSIRFRYFDDSGTTHDSFFTSNGEHDVPANKTTGNASGFSVEGLKGLYVGVTIEQIGEYEGAYCLDGVDDFITIPTLSSGSKQMLMKVNWNSLNHVLYDQRNNAEAPFCIVTASGTIAYNQRNVGGNTYIDGILNNHILVDDLQAITHNIVLNNDYNVANSNSFIGTNYTKSIYAKMSLYDFMLFDEISTDDKIKELNEYVGVEGNVFAINPTIKIDLPLAIKNIKIYHDGNEINLNSLFINKDTEFEIHISLNEGNYAIDNITVDGVNINKDRIVGDYNIFKFTLNGSSEQNIAIHDYKYIKYEDIVQPYPTIFELKDVDTNTTYTYGSKLKIGSEFLFNKWTNLLPELYRPTGSGRYNGNEFKTGNRYVVEETMVFSWSSPIEYLLDSAPKCIFSPSKLRMPNESYRYLGYIPDISGNGNNGVFNNFAFGGMSGVDGYPFNFRTIAVLVKKVSFTDDTLVIDRTSTGDQTWALNLGKQSESFDLYVNWEDDSTRLLVWVKSGTIVSRYILNKEWNNIPAVTDDYDYMYLSYVDSGVLGETTIKQKAKYEGSICFDGVDDSILTSIAGGRTVFIKTTVTSTNPRILYDQRDVNEQGFNKNFAIYTSNENILAYAARNSLGETYIDGVLNKNITCANLINIKHNITATTPEPVGTERGVRLGASNSNASYCKAAMYDFAIFDNVLPSDEIKQFNDIIGIEGDYVQKPNYYWDAYGKTNFDIGKDIIPQRGTEKGYNLADFTNWYYKTDSNSVGIVARNPYSITLKRLEGVNDFEFRNAELKAITNPVTVKFKSNKDIGFIYDYHYRKIGESGESTPISNGVRMTANEEFTFTVNPVSQDDIDKYNIDVSTGYYMLYFRLNALSINEEVTIEMLPIEGGKSLALTNSNFAYDKMSGYGGYSFKSFNDSQDSWNIRGDGTGVEIISRDGYSMTVKKLVQNLDWNISNNEYRYPTILNKELPFKCKSNKNVGLIWQLKYKTEGATADTTVTLLNQQLTPNVPLEVSLPYKTQDELTELGAVQSSIYYLLYFSNTLLEIGEEYTIEMLPLYPNGLVFDGVDDYMSNDSIPTFTDYTYIFKRTLLNKKYNSASIFKGGNQQSGGGAFICDYNSVEPDLLTQGYSFGAGLYVNSLNTSSIVYGTRSSVNGTKITAGNNTDIEGLTVGKWRAYKEMVFYKLFLYPRTIDMLSINMVKNMMEEDGIIDLTSKLFTDRYTGDFYEMDFNNDFLIGN